MLQTLVGGSFYGVGDGDGGLPVHVRQNAELHVLAVVGERKRDVSVGTCG